MKIAVVGSINMDQTVMASRIPHAGETVTGTGLKYVPGGKGANQAVAMARLGADVEMFGCVGDDNAGRELTDNLRNNGVRTSRIGRVQDQPTGMAVITVAEGDNTIVIIAGANSEVTVDYIRSVQDALLEAGMVLLQHEIPQKTIDYVIRLCSEHGITVMLNPAPARPVSSEMMDKISFLTPNEHEAAVIFGEEREFSGLLQEFPGKLIITQGSAGVDACTEDGKLIHVPARHSHVVDTTGAGDTMVGAFAVRISEGAGLEEALRFANTAAGLSVEKAGAQGGMPSRAQVEKAVEEQD